ncbi:DUF2855 family protein [Microscilla marina]|uniref:DUF2855 domain-containing protein n=1 Tax=Microscilla marina ATCC 23134 TaxID=313606 RepID=A1ZCH7_MICM2|nr:DUF2855 family protein [Microscilla marina]EAY31979.1 conserved hypothetical protein [Microscilla marina ATCC 23134]
MLPIKAKNFVVELNNLSAGKTVETSYSENLQPHQVLLKIDQFAFTSNNITYAIVGDKMGYWKFFPTQERHGIIPVWGFADVAVSNHPDILPGQRFYGYYPMSSHLLVTAGKVAPHSFIDVSTHRQGLAPVYNSYVNITQDLLYHPQKEALHSLYAPLFQTSFLIEDLVADQAFFGATHIVLTSASSKTAQALAFLLALRKKQENLSIHIVGLTSAKNTDFVQQLGWYDQVLTYGQITTLNPQQKHVVVDFTGNHQTQYQLQTHLQQQLAYNCLVGLTDWQHLQGAQTLPQPGEFFFAPTQMQKRVKDWGLDELKKRVAKVWHQFTTEVQPAIVVDKHQGSQALEQLYQHMLSGQVDPQKGHTVSLGG